MAITIDDLVEKARRRLHEQGETIDADLEAMVPEALSLLGDRCAAHEDPRYRSLAQADFTFAMVAGVVALTAQPTVIREHILRVTHPVHGVMQNAETRAYLEAEKSNLFFWYAIEIDSLYGRFGDGVTVPGDGTLTVRAQFTPTLSTLHVQLESDLVTVLLEIGRQGAPAAAA